MDSVGRRVGVVRGLILSTMVMIPDTQKAEEEREKLRAGQCRGGMI